MARIGDGGDLLKCNFCGKSQKQVKKLIAGPNVYICDECIELCNEIIEEELAEGSEVSLEELPKPREIFEFLNAYVIGQAASAAAILLAAGTTGKRMALPNSRILIHQPYTEGTFGQTSDIEIQANEILRMRELLERMIADSSGKDIDQVSADIERDKILTAEQAVEYGLIDAVIESRKGAPALV